MTFDLASMTHTLDSAASEGRHRLLEHEVYRFLEAAGCETPRHVLIKPNDPVSLAAVRHLPSRDVILKIVSPEIAHKTDVGGVKKVPNDECAIAQACSDMLRDVPQRYARMIDKHDRHSDHPYGNLSGPSLEAKIRQDIRGVLAVEYIAFDNEGPGSEVLIALRHNREFGPVITMGVGGIDTELLGGACKPGLSVVSGSAAILTETEILDIFRPTIAYQRLSGLTRSQKRLTDDAALIDVLRAFRNIANAFGSDGPTSKNGWTITELEVNPFAVSKGRLMPLDGLLSFRKGAELPLARPISSLGPMLKPQSMALIGVSAKGMNMGRIILRNILEAGFNRERAYVIRADAAEVDGVRCVPNIRALPEKVDVFVLAVGADQVPSVMEELIAEDKATGVILIAGGMGEKVGGQSGEMRVKTALAKSRQKNNAIVVNGGNCLGIVSRPGKYHTLFIPQNKLPLREDGKSNVAFLSQSGAYMISRMSKLDWISPRYAVSTGNQIDLTVTDFLEYMADDKEVQTFAVYVEGFRDGDGLHFARVVGDITRSGRDVIFYKAGRTAEGKSATSGHTASLAGDYEVCESLARQAGAYVARDFVEYLDLVRISSLLGGKKWNGLRLAAVSNAGYETVGIADSVHGNGWRLTLPPVGPQTHKALSTALSRAKLDALVDVRNPLDVTPMADDETYERVVEAFIADSNVDLFLCASVPLTPVQASLASGVPEEFTIHSERSIVNRLGRLCRESDKPIAACVDSGILYDPMVRALEEKGIPTFRSADAAVRALGIYAEGRNRNRTRTAQHQTPAATP